MRLALQLVVTTAFFIATSVAVAGAFDDGQAAYEQHDYATALQIWRPLADDGDAAAQGRLGIMYAFAKASHGTMRKP